MRKIKLLLCIVSIGLFSGCSKWLNIDPKTEVGSDELFKSTKGFNVALNGIYVELTDKKFYGGDLNYGAIEALSQSFSTQNTVFVEFANYNYEYSSTKSWIDDFWRKSYNLIANCNEIIKQADSKEAGFFKPTEYESIKGEALALRAMLHLNLVRLFAPAPVTGDDTPLLPYNKNVSHMGEAKIPTSQFMEEVIADFSDACNLLAVKDTLALYKTEMRTSRFAFSYTAANKSIGYRPNYYATKALLARAALYCGNRDLAKKCAEEVIAAKDNKLTMITFTPASAFSNDTYDRVLSQDLLFALYRPEADIVTDFTKANYASTYLANVEYIFPKALVDNRKLLINNAGGNSVTYKYTLLRPNNVKPLLPIIRLSEMYFILSEVLSDSDPAAATAKLDYLQKQRGATVTLVTANTKAEFIELLTTQVRRETIAEGQLFFFYKRLNLSIINETTGNKTLTKEFYFPIPQSEIIG